MKEQDLFLRFKANANRLVDIAYDLGLSEYYVFDYIYSIFGLKRKEEEKRHNNMFVNGELFKRIRTKIKL